MLNPADLGNNTEGAIVAIGGALVALAVPINTLMLVILNRRQKEGNHHTETIRQLAAAVSNEDVPGDLDKIPPEELGERVAEAAVEAREGKS